MKHCHKCNQKKPFEAFYASNRHKSGYAAWCKQCESERSRLKNLGNKEKRLITAKIWRESNKEIQAIAIKNWRENNQDKLKATYQKWAERNPDKVNAKWMKREASKKQRTPTWLTEDDFWMIEQVYDIAAKRKQMLGGEWHVDHIVPLQGKTVSGLHVPWNLQVLSGTENRTKSNHF
jgi:hypothetical protein